MAVAVAVNSRSIHGARRAGPFEVHELRLSGGVELLLGIARPLELAVPWPAIFCAAEIEELAQLASQAIEVDRGRGVQLVERAGARGLQKARAGLEPVDDQVLLVAANLKLGDERIAPAARCGPPRARRARW